APEVRRVHAESEPAVRDPPLQLEIPPRVGSPRSLPLPLGGEGMGEGASPHAWTPPLPRPAPPPSADRPLARLHGRLRRHAPLELGLTAFFLAVLVAVPIGLLSAMRRNSVLDHTAMGLALIGQAAPTFFIGILFILLLALKADLFPTSGRGGWLHLVLPALTLGAFTMASIARLTRSAVLEVLRADYIRTARA